MSFGYLLEIFGGTGAVVLGIGTIIWGFCKTHEFKWDYDEEEKKEPIEVLNEEWENPGENFSIEENFGSNWNRLKFAVQHEDKWKININKKEGDVYIYTKKDRAPPKCNGGKHFLRVKMKNVTRDMKVRFVHKCFDISYNQIHDNNHKDIRREGVHIFEPECIIDLQNNHENVVKKEQLGIYITGKYKDIKNVVIDEAYYGEKWSFRKLWCCRRYILCRRKPNED